MTAPTTRPRSRLAAGRFVAVVALMALAVCLLAVLAARVPRSVPTRASLASKAKVASAIASGRMLFVGASYTVGLGATSPRAGYATVVADRLDRRFTVAAASGTGFLSRGPHGRGTFAERMHRLPASLDPRVVVIQGGRNDIGYAPTRVQAAALATIRQAEAQFGHAQVVVMGPIPARLPVGPRLLAIRDAVDDAAETAQAGFVDPIAERWITVSNEHRFAGPVPQHPNDAGYAYIADRLIADLPRALDEAGPPRSAQPGTRPAAPAPPSAADVAGRAAQTARTSGAATAPDGAVAVPELPVPRWGEPRDAARGERGRHTPPLITVPAARGAA